MTWSNSNGKYPQFIPIPSFYPTANMDTLTFLKCSEMGVSPTIKSPSKTFQVHLMNSACMEKFYENLIAVEVNKKAHPKSLKRSVEHCRTVEHTTSINKSRDPMLFSQWSIGLCDICQPPYRPQMPSFQSNCGRRRIDIPLLRWGASSIIAHCEAFQIDPMRSESIQKVQ